jgi:hypothetical protein
LQPFETFPQSDKHPIALCGPNPNNILNIHMKKAPFGAFLAVCGDLGINWPVGVKTPVSQFFHPLHFQFHPFQSSVDAGMVRRSAALKRLSRPALSCD